MGTAASFTGDLHEPSDGGRPWFGGTESAEAQHDEEQRPDLGKSFTVDVLWYSSCKWTKLNKVTKESDAGDAGLPLESYISPIQI